MGYFIMPEAFSPHERAAMPAKVQQMHVKCLEHHMKQPGKVEKTLRERPEDCAVGDWVHVSAFRLDIITRKDGSLMPFLKFAAPVGPPNPQEPTPDEPSMLVWTFQLVKNAPYYVRVK